MNVFLRSFWASTMATSSMTTSLFSMFSFLSDRDHKPLPPAQLTETMRRKVNAPTLGAIAEPQATLLSHYAYGLACGTVYSAVNPYFPGSAVKKGLAFGLGVWGASYFGLIPAISGKPQGREMSAQRNGMMLIAHVIWGTTLAFTEEKLRREGSAMLDARNDLRS